jgi:hypothetical protein
VTPPRMGAGTNRSQRALEPVERVVPGVRSLDVPALAGPDGGLLTLVRDNADQSAIVVDDGQPAQPVLAHAPRRLRDRGVRAVVVTGVVIRPPAVVAPTRPVSAAYRRRRSRCHGPECRGRGSPRSAVTTRSPLGHHAEKGASRSSTGTARTPPVNSTRATCVKGASSGSVLQPVVSGSPARVPRGSRPAPGSPVRR